MTILNQGLEGPTDSDHAAYLARVADYLDDGGQHGAATDTRAAISRLTLRSCQLNNILYRLGIAAGFRDMGGRIDAAPEAIIAKAEHLLAVPDPGAPIEGKANLPGTETALEAARRPEHLIRWGNDRTRLLLALEERHVHGDNALFPHLVKPGDTGATAARLADSFGWSRNQTATRLLELRELGLVEYRMHDGKVITAPTNDKGTAHGRVQFITEQGLEACRQLRASRP